MVLEVVVVRQVVIALRRGEAFETSNVLLLESERGEGALPLSLHFWLVMDKSNFFSH